jgi:uncharacterized protein GlcG (DUF336 family)
MNRICRLTIAAAAVLAAPAFAQPPTAPATPPPPAKRIEAALAQEAVEAAIDACAAQNLKISAAVSDAAGLPIYVLVPDGVRNGTGDVAIRKNLTMAITGRPASETAALAAADPALEAKLVANPRTVRFPGGVPLKAGDDIVGFISGSGVTGAQDEACAKAGADKIAARIK